MRHVWSRWVIDSHSQFAIEPDSNRVLELYLSRAITTPFRAYRNGKLMKLSRKFDPGIDIVLRGIRGHFHSFQVGRSIIASVVFRGWFLIQTSFHPSFVSFRLNPFARRWFIFLDRAHASRDIDIWKPLRCALQVCHQSTAGLSIFHGKSQGREKLIDFCCYVISVPVYSVVLRKRAVTPLWSEPRIVLEHALIATHFRMELPFSFLIRQRKNGM